jgi:phosphohistidine phosphatase
MNIYVIRHGIAIDPGTPGFEEDSQRPLTEKGIKKMNSIARGLRAFDVKLDLILSSPYLRARQTAEILADVFKIEDRLAFSENLVPLGYPDQLIGEINEKYSVDSLALVGHEPALSSLISVFLAGSLNISINMKKGGVCCLAFDDLRHERSATLEWLLTPAQLIKLVE